MIQSLHIYPVKSCRGTSLTKMSVDIAGPNGDREWMLVDKNGYFLTQRTMGKMALVETALDKDQLTIAFAGQYFKLSRNVNKFRYRKVKIWSTEVDAHEEPLLYSQALSQFLGVECFLVKYTDLSKRTLTSKNESYPAETRFTDRKPIQIVNLKSLAELNSRLEDPVGADRFRANIVFDGQEPYEEESWKRIQIGSVILSQPRKCARCKVITLDAKTGEAPVPGEPLKTLSTYRKDGLNKVNFGVLWIPENEGVIAVGDQIQVLA